MNKLKMKAKAGVTLVELLVVILIVTILSVSMLPLLQPFVTEAQYAAEAIPVIGSIRTKIGVNQYNNGKLPCIAAITADVTDPNTGNKTSITTPYIETWIPVATAASTSAGNAAINDIFKMGYYSFPSSLSIGTLNFVTDTSATPHFGVAADLDYQELKGKRCKPCHFQYLVLQNDTEYAYFLGCFGDNNGLKAGTGYAVCEIVAKGHKYVGTWSRYKALTGVNALNQLFFTSAPDKADPDDPDPKHTAGCWVPTVADFKAAADGGNGQLDIIATMITRGWEF